MEGVYSRGLRQLGDTVMLSAEAVSSSVSLELYSEYLVPTLAAIITSTHTMIT